MRYAHIVPTVKSLAPESEEDDLSSSKEVVNKEFDKKEFLLRFQENMVAAMSTAMSEVISKLLEQPTKNHGEKQHRKIYTKERQNTSQMILEQVVS